MGGNIPDIVRWIEINKPDKAVLWVRSVILLMYSQLSDEHVWRYWCHGLHHEIQHNEIGVALTSCILFEMFSKLSWNKQKAKVNTELPIKVGGFIDATFEKMNHKMI